MNKVFSCLMKGRKGIAKYVIFSFTFIMACLFMTSGIAKAGVSDYSGNSNIDGITSINGTLSTSCSAPANSDNLSYSIIESSHKGNGENDQCISYTESDGSKTYFYLQATDAADTTNKITFTVTSTSQYNYISIFEPGFTMSSTSSTYDYDFYTYNSTSSTYAYQRLTDTAKPEGQNGSISVDTTSGVVFTFTYTLRDASYGAHNINVYLYDANYDQPNPTHSVQLSYVLAKPINEYTASIYNNIADACDLTGSSLCIVYNDSNKVTTGTNATNYFEIKFSNKAAFYFSTVNTHGVTPTPTIVEQYNSVYAENTFSNIDKNDTIVYHYFNLKDESTYDYALTTKADKYYNFKLTIDASGNYAFYLTDIFGNTITISHATDLEITDISNRDLTIYYLSYNADGSIKNYSESLEDFELKNDLSLLTNANIKLGLEFYFKIKIDGSYAVSDGPAGQIKMNPLYYEAADKQISMGTDAAPKTYYCRQNVDTCVTSVAEGKNASQFVAKILTGTQSIAGNDTTGLKSISNEFTFVNGLIDDADTSETTFAKTTRLNRVDVQINENGKFYVRVEDTHGNSKESTIDISIVDQMRPVITVNGAASLYNYICSSMYVIGGGGTINTYPTGQLTADNCSANSAYYDMFEVIDASAGTEMQVTIRDTFKHLRNGTNGSSETSTNGFYNTGTTTVNFSYADAIRIALLEASDSMTIYNGEGVVNKSLYTKTSDTHTSYSISTLNSSNTLVNVTSGYTSAKRENYQNDVIIANNYLQYASELIAFDGASTQFVRYEIYLITDTSGTTTADPICSSVVNPTDCDNIVNAYIDKAITFKMKFVATDYAGNDSKDVWVTVDVVDNTTPGIASIDSDGVIGTDPIIAKNNIDTECRLEIGINLQNKTQLLDCYGLLEGTNYNFVDNATTYELLAKDSYSTNKYYTSILYQQLYGISPAGSYADNIKVYICSAIGDGACSDNGVAGASWQEVTTTDITFAYAGSYEIKFEITDTGYDYLNSHDKNKTTLIFCYYVNPRVLLVRPLEKTKTYGEANTAIDYCVYATKNSNAVFYNLFNITADGTYADTYDFVYQNYESELYGMVYCTSELTNDTEDTDATVSSELEILVNNDANFTGNLARTYATGSQKYKLELGTETYNAYEDAGYYYITMGDLAIGGYSQNYVLRLHPSYLLDNTIPDTTLKNYDELTGDQYKYGVNTNSHGETISNVLYTIKQAKLQITANAGSKVYGHVDTNYSQAFNGAAATNISGLTYKITGSDGIEDTTDAISTAGYLNGYQVSGLIHTGVSDTAAADYTNTLLDYSRYGSIIEGYLRREAGEHVGQYYICNTNVVIKNTLAHTDCSIRDLAINTVSEIELTTANVFRLDSDGTTYTAITNVSEIIYGLYVKISDGVYYKLTRNNTNLTTKIFEYDMGSNLWKYNYDDSTYSIKILANTNNGNQNYYIEYEAAIYTINPRNLIVQPGANQGKEYSNPTHNDPMFEIVVYGEPIYYAGEGLSIKTIEDASSFNGYTEDISVVGYPSVTPYNQSPYSNTSGGKEADSELYYTDRRTRTTDIGSGVTYTYKFDEITLASNEFTLDGVTFVYDSTNNKICAKLNQTTECYDNGAIIGGYTVTVAETKVIITLPGVLTYQNYELFADASGVAGSGNISREGDENVGWYSYTYSAANLHAITNGKSFCNVTNYDYSVDGTSLCADFEIIFNDNAPSKSGSEFTTSSVGSEYLHNGNNYCSNLDIYSYSCGEGITKIKFAIFKRDIIISFDAQTAVYGNVYSYFKNGVFAIADSTDIPSVITCYKKNIDATSGYFTGKNGIKYTKIEDTECASVDYGLSTGDKWGASGLNLDLFLNEAIATKFTETTYPIPSGLYFVYATIGSDSDNDGKFLHNNYNLVYIDYDILVKGDKDPAGTENQYPDNKNGALEITPKPVDLVGTYYQKEFGQAVYATYGSNGETLTNNGEYIDGQLTAKLSNNKVINIFDNHYYYCEIATAQDYNGKNVIYGCAIEHDGNADQKYYFNDAANVYLYTSSGMISLAEGKTDEIYVNFAGTPVRERLNATENDSYGLLDDVGYYSISLGGIIPVVAQYSDVTFSKDAGTIFRDTNYSINSVTAGRLYITPAQIEIEVTANQTKMYGCAYNTLNTSISSVYSYADGYSNCVETVAQYYDLGYEYTVKNDKANYLKEDDGSGAARYASFNGGNTPTCSNWETGECDDMSYDGVAYTVTPNYTTTGDGNASAPTDGKPTNTSLNSGTLFRIPTSSGTETISYNYQEYYTNGNNSQLAINDSNIKFQNQNIGTYAITLGNLDSKFNNNAHCSAYSLPDATGNLKCKNFIVNYGGNNTSTHTNNGTTDVFDTTYASFALTINDFKFTIQERKVVITTEYNYKVYGDTEPNEGYTCLNLKDIFTYTGRFGNDFVYTGRDYCSGADADDKFISTGVARFYAIDNSLAKAPWTGWVDNSGNYDSYNDTLYDVLSTSSKINRKGESGVNTPNMGDAVGKYAYVYDLYLNEALNGNNYKINYLSAAASGTNSTDATNIGFATQIFDGATLKGLDRWYDDANHLCRGTECNSYNGSQVYEFVINGLDYNSENSYKTTKTVEGTTTTLVSELVSEVYFEIVRREIFIKTEEVTKDYGIEDNYNMFNVKLCSDYESGVCTEVQPATVWGTRNSLSKADYDAFYPGGTFSQAAFKGSDQASAYRGATEGTYAKAFGIYFYRTYGEVTSEYVIVACATQNENDMACRNYYNGLSDDEARISDIKSFTVDTATNARNASNYIVKTIPAKITIAQRQVHITPDEDQGFMYGNYEAGKVVPPITYKEYYAPNATKSETMGLVNGGLYDNNDSITNQIALCIYDISERLTCINDRQNSSGEVPAGYVTTGLHGAYDESYTKSGTIGFNVYNDTYTADNTTTRFALNRSLESDTDARYNRNVGVYTITAGELYSTEADWDPWCDAANGITSNCLNVNYEIVGFDEGEEYEITPATVIVTPVENQYKVYGQSDIQIKFTVVTKFELDTDNADKYYCAANNCQNDEYSSSDFATTSSYDSNTRIITLDNFAYSEDASELAYNYGQSRQGNKVTGEGTFEEIASTFASDGADNPKYYDKYCNGMGSDCSSYVGSTHEYASLIYGNTTRILLGYFYVEGWYQKAGTHKILSGISVALNEFNNQNYLYKTAYGAAQVVGMGADTGYTFEIKQLDLVATIKDVTKVYGQATDAYKCDASAAANCATNFATLSALNNENRLEFNFDINDTTDDADDFVNLLDGKVLLTQATNSNYYTQTGLAEYKNVHLGLTVVRAINNATTCISTTDNYGCEDVGEYTLVFRKQDVPNDVDLNYNVMYMTADGTTKASLTFSASTGYAVVNANSELASTSEPNADANARSEEAKYITYPTSGIDSIPTGQNSDATSNSISINVSGYSETLTIVKRSVVFYVGTYNDDGTVSQRYIIEQNEQVPKLPELNAEFTTSSTDPKSKQVYYVTWFDYKEYPSGPDFGTLEKTIAPRQVRTSDALSSSQDAYGVGLCKGASTNIQGEEYGTGNCSEDKFVLNDNANNISGNAYVFDTSIVGDYAIVRNKEVTYITSRANEDKNYDTLDFNGTLVIFEDQTAPIIQVGNSEFVIEANANTVGSCTTPANNVSGQTFYYDCVVSGLLFDEANKSLGQIIKYLTENFSGYDDGSINNNLGESWQSENKSTFKLPDNLSAVDYETWRYLPVNNIGITSTNKNTTLYSVDRYLNTYDFDTDYINTNLVAITSIVSWFNINSYDYSYIRANSYPPKRYTPRYYAYIKGNDALSAFDPTYVGDFTITIYAIDDVGNQSSMDVTLKVVDTTKPVVSQTYIFNAPVVCDATDKCVANNIDSWYVKEGVVSIDAFIKYNSSGIEDNTNGTYIMLNGTLLDIYGNTITKYQDAAGTIEDILGKYVRVNAGATLAKEVEHKYWSNSATKHLVIVGGKDNSYIDPGITDDKSQWDSYYTINGTDWYKYDRHDLDGVTINFAEGANTLITRVMDSGRKFTMSTTENGYVYYNDLYLRPVSDIETGQDACYGLSDCAIADNTGVNIEQVTNIVMTTTDSGATYKFKIHSTDVTYSVGDGTMTWAGQQTAAEVTVESGVKKFTFGIMSCSIDESGSDKKVSCEAEYHLVYNNSASSTHRVAKTKPAYTIETENNLAEWHEIADGSVTGFYNDRRYIFVDTAKPTISLEGHGYSVFEYSTKCDVSITGSDDSEICKRSYDEKFLTASDSATGSAVLSVGGSTTSKTGLNIDSYGNIIMYTGQEYSKVTSVSGYTSSGLLANDTIIMSGATSSSGYRDANSDTTFNKLYLDLVIYLHVKTSSNTYARRYLAIYNGSKYIIFTQDYDSTLNGGAGGYAVITEYPNTTSTYDTVEDVLEHIVSTKIVEGTSYEGADLTFSINYSVRDAANNISTPISNSTVRGVTYTKLTSTIGVELTPAAASVMSLVEDNTYVVNANQGVSLVTLLDGFEVSNVGNNGTNNMNSIRQSLYYNGEAIFENMPYSIDVLSVVDDYASSPGTYTLRLTSQREVLLSQGTTQMISDKPLEISFVITPARADVISEGDYSRVIATSITLIIGCVFMLGMGYISLKKSKKQ